ncbi:MAG: thioredoxin family protein [Arachnia sp.]
MDTEYLPESLERSEVDALPGKTVVQFGTNWCGYCVGARRVIDGALDPVADIRRILVEDGRGRPLGRSYGVKLWPTLIFLCDGAEVARVVRPSRARDLEPAMAALRAACAQPGDLST